MITLLRNESYTNALRAGLQLIVTVTGSGYALVERYRDQAQVGSAQITSALSPFSFGPHNLDITYRVQAFACTVTFDHAEALQTLGSADA